MHFLEQGRSQAKGPFIHGDLIRQNPAVDTAAGSSYFNLVEHLQKQGIDPEDSRVQGFQDLSKTLNAFIWP